MADRKIWQNQKPVLIGMAAFLLLIVGVGGWSTQTEIAGAMAGKGRIVVDTETQLIQHPQGGVVAEVLAADGDFVKAGDVVIRLDDFALRNQLNIVEGALFEALALEARLRAEIDGDIELEIGELLATQAETSPDVAELIRRQQAQLNASYATVAQKTALIRKRIDQIESQIVASDAQMHAKQEQIALVEADLENAESLSEQGLFKASERSKLLKEKTRLLGEVGSQAAKVAELEEKITELELELLVLPADMRNKAAGELSKMRPETIKSRETRIDLLASLDQLEVRSPVSGMIHDSQIYGVRSVLVEAKPIMYVVPTDRPAIAVVKVDARDVDQIYAGQDATLRFSTFNRRSTPLIQGRVLSVSADAFLEPKKGTYYYEARIGFADDELKKLGDKHLVPGMPVEAFVGTEKRTPLNYVLKPLVDYFNRAYRDV